MSEHSASPANDQTWLKRRPNVQGPVMGDGKRLLEALPIRRDHSSYGIINLALTIG